MHLLSTTTSHGGALPGKLLWSYLVRFPRLRPSSILLVDFPISLINYHVLSYTIGVHINCMILRTERPYLHPEPTSMILGYAKEDFVQPTAGRDASLGWLTEFCGHGFPSRAVLLPYRNRLLASVLFLVYNIFADHD